MKKGILIDFGDTIIYQKVDDEVPLSKMDLSLFPDSYLALSKFKEDGFLIALVSNTTQSTAEDVEIALEKIGIKGFIDSIVTSVDVGEEKPSKEMFLKALKSLGLQADEVLMIGDDFEKDIIGAKNVGIEGILINRGIKSDKIDGKSIIVTSLLEIPELLRT